MKLAHEGIDVEVSAPNSEFKLIDNPILKYVRKHPYTRNQRFYGSPKEPKTFRIVLVGDSVAYGSCKGGDPIQLHQTFPALLEDSLNKSPLGSKARFEVANLSVPGYNTLSEAEYLRIYGLRLDPDMVIVAYNPNDRCFGDFIQFDRPFKDGDVAFQFYRSSALFRYLWRAKKNLEKQYSCSWDIPREGFQKIFSLAQQHNFRTLVVTIPQLQWGTRDPKDFDYSTALNLAQEAGHDVLDVFPAMKKAEPDLLKFEGRCTPDHPDENGHIVIAEALRDYISEHPGIAKNRQR